MSTIGDAGIGFGLNMAGDALGIGLNMATHGLQVKQQQDFINQQMAANKQMQAYSQGLGIDTWNRTNYEAQMAHLKNAGLNPGLIYGQGGGGGATTNSGSAAGVQGGQAHPASVEMGMQSGAQLALINAQKNNIEADTVLKQKEAGVKTVQAPNVEADTAQKTAQTANTVQQTKLAEYNTQIAKINSEIKTEGKSLEIGTLNSVWNKLNAETALTEEQTNVAKQQVIETAAKTALLKSDVLKNASDIEVNNTKIAEMANSISQRWAQLEIEGKKLGQTDQEINLKKAQVALQTISTQFNTSTPQQIKQWQEIFTNMLGAATGGAKNISGAMIPLL